ncbi:MAG TPA: Zn-dependent hydrolase [Terriglobales bacterium]|nr:Zn-dependent hydrolase [Terriglobales bacterium]
MLIADCGRLVTIAAVPTRREFLYGITATALATPAGSFAWPPDTDLRVNPGRLRRRLEALSIFGRPEGGSFADGVSRLGYSDADVAARAWVMDQMRAAGLEPRIDPAGNILARRAGTDAALPPILFGSHIDSVPNGGNFDGDVGSMSSIEVAHTLREAGKTTRHPLEVVIWANEEGVAYGKGLDGSRAAAGQLMPGELEEVWNGVARADAIRKVGGAPERIAEAQRKPGSFHCYLELHIEQGGTLDQAGIPIGIVEGIVAIDHYDVEIRGFANHAGTTPMPGRKDALLAASELALEVNRIVRSEPGRQVGTVGRLLVEPNAPNVIPGRVRLTVELRDLSGEKIARLAESVRGAARAIATRTGTEIDMKLASHHEAALATPAVQRAIEQAADSLGLRHTRLPSGAGHDAQMMARLGPMGMIFVPSVGGISHSPREFSRWDQIAQGADVLLHTILALDTVVLSTSPR